MHPYKEWTYLAYAWSLPSAGMVVLWLINYIFGHDGDFVDWVFKTLYFLMFLQAPACLVGGLWASQSYGTEAEVTLGTDWALTVDDDPDYSFVLLINSVISFVSLMWHIMAYGALDLNYDAIQMDKKYQKEQEAREEKKEFRSGDCDFGMIEGEGGLCYHPKDKEWNWEF